MAYTAKEFAALDLKKLNPPKPPQPHWTDLMGELIEKHPVGLPINPRIR